MKEIIDNISLKEFIELVNLDDKLIVLDFFAQWCGPCKRLTPFLEQCSKTYKDIHFYKIDVDNNEDVCQQFDIKCMPTLVFIKNKKVEHKLEGLSQTILEKNIQNYEELDRIEGINETKILETIQKYNLDTDVTENSGMTENPIINELISSST